MEQESLEKKTVRALRGRILSADGKVLVESNRQLKLILSHRIQSHQLSAYLAILEKEIGLKRRDLMIKISRMSQSENVVLHENLSLDQMKKFVKVFGVNRDLFIKMSFSRKKMVKDRKNMIGEVQLVDGNYVGVSGLEKKYNQQLRGQDLVYETLVDKRGDVILKTFNEIQKLQTGQDIFLKEEEWP
ncbi:MAG: hypothetical protein MK132_11335 [Lentisphaerales bacterium]|nr:hypothetical protein [Lentisphaerales bacterium]